jgi:hypothetical protein
MSRRNPRSRRTYDEMLKQFSELEELPVLDAPRRRNPGSRNYHDMGVQEVGRKRKGAGKDEKGTHFAYWSSGVDGFEPGLQDEWQRDYGEFVRTNTMSTAQFISVDDQLRREAWAAVTAGSAAMPLEATNSETIKNSVSTWATEAVGRVTTSLGYVQISKGGYERNLIKLVLERDLYLSWAAAPQWRMWLNYYELLLTRMWMYYPDRSDYFRAGIVDPDLVEDYCGREVQRAFNRGVEIEGRLRPVVPQMDMMTKYARLPLEKKVAGWTKFPLDWGTPGRARVLDAYVRLGVIQEYVDSSLIHLFTWMMDDAPTVQGEVSPYGGWDPPNDLYNLFQRFHLIKRDRKQDKK